MWKLVLLILVLLLAFGCAKEEEPLYCFEIVIVGDYSPSIPLNLESAKHIAFEFLQNKSATIDYSSLFGIKNDLGGYIIIIKEENVEIKHNNRPLKITELQLNSGKIFAKKPTFC